MIVVLMRLSENGKVKGHRYWPKRSKRCLQFGEVSVTLVKGKHFPHRADDVNHPDGDQVRTHDPYSSRQISFVSFQNFPQVVFLLSSDRIPHFIVQVMY